MEYVYLIGRLIAHPAVTNILLLMVMLSLWKIQDIISSVITTDRRGTTVGTSYSAEAIRVQTGD